MVETPVKFGSNVAAAPSVTLRGASRWHDSFGREKQQAGTSVETMTGLVMSWVPADQHTYFNKQMQ